jgi:hypothetical protein
MGSGKNPKSVSGLAVSISVRALEVHGRLAVGEGDVAVAVLPARGVGVAELVDLQGLLQRFPEGAGEGDLGVGPAVGTLGAEVLEEAGDVDRAADGVVQEPLGGGPRVPVRHVDRRDARLLEDAAGLDEGGVGGRHLQPVPGEDLPVVQHRGSHHGVGDHAGATGIGGVLVHQVHHRGADVRLGEEVGDVGELAALLVGGHLVVVVQQAEGGRVAAGELGGEAVRDGVVDHSDAAVLLGVEGLDQLAEVGDGLSFGLVERELAPAAAPASGEAEREGAQGGAAQERAARGPQGPMAIRGDHVGPPYDLRHTFCTE